MRIAAIPIVSLVALTATFAGAQSTTLDKWEVLRDHYLDKARTSRQVSERMREEENELVERLDSYRERAERLARARSKPGSGKTYYLKAMYHGVVGAELANDMLKTQTRLNALANADYEEKLTRLERDALRNVEAANSFIRAEEERLKREREEAERAKKRAQDRRDAEEERANRERDRRERERQRSTPTPSPRPSSSSKPSGTVEFGTPRCQPECR